MVVQLNSDEFTSTEEIKVSLLTSDYCNAWDKPHPKKTSWVVFRCVDPDKKHKVSHTVVRAGLAL